MIHFDIFSICLHKIAQFVEYLQQSLLVQKVKQILVQSMLQYLPDIQCTHVLRLRFCDLLKPKPFEGLILSYFLMQFDNKFHDEEHNLSH